MTLCEFFQMHPQVALAFSGGVDSAYLLYAAINCGAKVRAYYVKSAFSPGSNWMMPDGLQWSWVRIWRCWMWMS